MTNAIKLDDISKWASIQSFTSSTLMNVHSHHVQQDDGEHRHAVWANDADVEINELHGEGEV